MGQITITNQLLTNPQWLEPEFCDFNLGSNVDVWKVIVDNTRTISDNDLALVTEGEMARASRFYKQTDRDRFIISRIAIRQILSKYTGQHPSALEFGLGENKKPFIKNQGNLILHYNLSHSENAILLALSGSPIGADVEHVKPDFGFSEILADNFNEAEIAFINEEQGAERFFRIWTRKEAITKATAQGLDIDLRLIPGIDGSHIVEPGIIASNDDWLITSFNLNDEYAASIATHPSIEKITFFSLEYGKNPLFFK